MALPVLDCPEYVPLVSCFQELGLTSCRDGSGQSEGLDQSGADDAEARKRAKIEELRDQLERCREAEKEGQKQNEQFDKIFEEKRTVLTSQVEALEKETMEVEQQLKELTDPKKTRTFPGPEKLAFLDTQAFRGFAAAVAIIQFMYFLFSMAHFTGSLGPVLPIFLSFYVAEFVLKVTLLRTEYFYGPIAEVRWNYADIVIAVVCISTSFHVSLTLGICARLFPLIKVGRFLQEWDVSFCESNVFETFIMSVIMLNSLCIAFEDYAPGLMLWTYLNMTMLAIFTFEVLVRIRYRGRRFFLEDVVWNYLDLIIVVGGLAGQSRPLVEAYLESVEKADMSRSKSINQFMMLLRLARLLRVLRLMKLIRHVKPLYTLVLGIAEAMHGMGWVVLLTVVWLYMGALCLVKLVGQGLVFGGEAPGEIRALFPDTPSAMWVLFKVMNGDPGDLDYLFDEKPYFKLIIAVFMIISSWAILSILTAVVSENMIAATGRLESEERSEEEDMMKKVTRTKLRQIFQAGDEDRDGKLTEVEFKCLIADTLRHDEICRAAKISTADVEELFYILSTAEAMQHGALVASIDQEDFIEGIMSHSESLTTRALFRLEKRLTTVVRQESRNGEKRLSDMMDKITEKFRQVTDDLEGRIDVNRKYIGSLHEDMTVHSRFLSGLHDDFSMLQDMAQQGSQERAELQKCIGKALARTPTLTPTCLGEAVQDVGGTPLPVCSEDSGRFSFAGEQFVEAAAPDVPEALTEAEALGSASMRLPGEEQALISDQTSSTMANEPGSSLSCGSGADGEAQTSGTSPGPPIGDAAAGDAESEEALSSDPPATTRAATKPTKPTVAAGSLSPSSPAAATASPAPSPTAASPSTSSTTPTIAATEFPSPTRPSEPRVSWRHAPAGPSTTTSMAAESQSARSPPAPRASSRPSGQALAEEATASSSGGGVRNGHPDEGAGMIANDSVGSEVYASIISSDARDRGDTGGSCNSVRARYVLARSDRGHSSGAFDSGGGGEDVDAAGVALEPSLSSSE